MGSFAKHMILCHANMAAHHRRSRNPPPSGAEETLPPPTPLPAAGRRSVLVTGLTGLAAAATAASAGAEQSWGTHSFIKEKYFQPALLPEEAAARIRQTAEGMKEMRPMLDRMSWRYVLFYVRQKSAYLDADLKNAMATLPEARRKPYVKAANELVDSMRELDYYVRTPKIYESYVYYEKALKSLDDVVALLA